MRITSCENSCYCHRTRFYETYSSCALRCSLETRASRNCITFILQKYVLETALLSLPLFLSVVTMLTRPLTLSDCADSGKALVMRPASPLVNEGEDEGSQTG